MRMQNPTDWKHTDWDESTTWTLLSLGAASLQSLPRIVFLAMDDKSGEQVLVDRPHCRKGLANDALVYWVDNGSP